MATYTGALAASGLPELADDGEIDFPAMTLRRALHVTLRDSGGNPVRIPDPPGSDEDDPAHITGEVEIRNKVTVRPDLTRFPNGRLPVDTGNPPITGTVNVGNLPAPVRTKKAQPLEFDVDRVDVSGSEVEIRNRVTVRPDLAKFGGRLPVDTGLVIPQPIPLPAFPTPAKQRDLSFDADAVDVSGSEVVVRDPVRIKPYHTVGGRPYGVIVSTTAVKLCGTSGGRRSIVITNKGGGILYIGFDSSVTTSGPSMGISLASTTGCYTDSGFGMYVGELWGIYSTAASSENVSVSDRY